MTEIATETASKTVTIAVDVSDEFCSNVLITAFDGSYGACWYWAQPSTVPDNGRWLTVSGVKGDDDRLWETVTIDCADEDLSGKVVDHAAIRSGIQKMLGIDKINPTLREALITGLVTDDAGDVDAEVADVIVQMFVFGELTFS